MVLPADHHPISGLIITGLKSYIVIGIAGVPIESIAELARRYPRRDHVGSVGCLLGMHCYAIVDRNVRRHYCRAGDDAMTGICFYLYSFAVPHSPYMGLAIDADPFLE